MTMMVILLTPNTTKFNADVLLILPVSMSIVSICDRGYAAHVILPTTYLHISITFRLFSINFAKLPICQ